MTRHSVALSAALIGVNIAAWIWALMAFRRSPTLLGVGALVYGLGLRHAVDADHITAIDNVTRKMLEEKRGSISVGLFFALGHSTVVVLVTVAITAAGSATSFETFRSAGGAISLLVSSSVLLALAAMNLAIFVATLRHRGIHAGATPAGILMGLIGPVVRSVRHGWQMFPIGFLFALGFDTATEVALFGVSSDQALQRFGLASVLVLPVLFASAMSLVDTLDSVLMTHAYSWAFVTPERRRTYNLVITLTSAVAAAAIGAAELYDLLGAGARANGRAAAAVGLLLANMNLLGFGLLAMFSLIWLVSFLLQFRGDPPESRLDPSNT